MFSLQHIREPQEDDATSSATSPPKPPLLTGARRAPILTPTERFRAVVRKMIDMRKTVRLVGIEPRGASTLLNYSHIRQRCIIGIMDYSSIRASAQRMGNAEFIRLLKDDNASRRAPWVKVRWINVCGVSWDVVSALALKYDLHPLSLESVLQERGNARSKADYYNKHLFLRVLCHRLSEDDENTSINFEDDNDNDDDEGEDAAEEEQDFQFGRTGVRNLPAPSRTEFADVEDVKANKNARNRALLRELKRGDRVNVNVSPLCIFLMRDGTVISMHKDNTRDFTAPISERLWQRQAGLRATADPSLLVQSLLDLVVDHALAVIDEYQRRILKLEQAVLLKPSMKTVRQLHILQGDLILHKRTLEPIKTVIYGLRRYDADRVAALGQHDNLNAEVEGYMSHKAKIYLAGVHDHMEYILTSLDMIAGITDNLINYAFNMASYDMNETMRQLTLATIIFLPLTLLTGYFGMNFEVMSIHHLSDTFFWEIAMPVMVVVVVLFMQNDIKRMVHYLSKRMARHRIKKPGRNLQAQGGAGPRCAPLPDVDFSEDPQDPRDYDDNDDDMEDDEDEDDGMEDGVTDRDIEEHRIMTMLSWGAQYLEDYVCMYHLANYTVFVHNGRSGRDERLVRCVAFAHARARHFRELDGLERTKGELPDDDTLEKFTELLGPPGWYLNGRSADRDDIGPRLESEEYQKEEGMPVVFTQVRCTVYSLGGRELT
ncbi:Magnesium transport protein CorA [Trametes pubescens]|uniref:Magnesium transport protein CorA n=1 Tax=Trametes pubescens TaxID=154538 RepID=A0A1M2VAI5_TRAPU|nr:Magnesium transport protein CorA [Trametes pubescens]